MAIEQLYNRIGAGYASRRRPDDRVFAQVLDALGSAGTIINVGAGTGNYEPTDRPVLAVEPSSAMLEQRTNNNATLQAFAEALPVRSGSFDAALAMFTIHHWTERHAGLAELARVAKRQVALIYDTAVTMQFWMVKDYFPRLQSAGWEVRSPNAEWIGQHLNLLEERVLMVPHDCTDGFSGAYWNRPERYLEASVQEGMSTLARLSDEVRQEGTERLRADLESGAWDDKYGHLRNLEWFDIGYRLVICEGAVAP